MGTSVLLASLEVLLTRGQIVLDSKPPRNPAWLNLALCSELGSLARDGKTNSKGIPGLPQIAVAYRELGDSCSRVTKPSVAIQDAVFVIMAPIGRMLGKRGVYARYSPDQPKA